MKRIVQLGASWILALLVTALPFSGLLSAPVAQAASVGEIVITEFMADPTYVTDDLGEWIEVHNTTGAPIDLQGWDLNTGSNWELGSSTPPDFGTWITINDSIDGSVVVPAGGKAVLCKNSTFASNGGVICDYDYSDTHTLNNIAGGDLIALRDQSDTIITQLTYAQTDIVPAGHSVNVNGGVLTPENTTTYNPADFGTPGTTAVVADTTAPAVPTHVSPADGVFMTPADVSLMGFVQWSDVSDPSTPVTYYYEASNSLALNPDGSFVTPFYQSPVLPNSEIGTSGSLTPLGTYYWHVRAVDGVGNSSAWSNAWTGHVVSDATAPIIVINATPISTDGSPVITGTVDDPTAVITVTIGGTTYPAINNGDGTWTLQVTPALTNGLYDVDVTATDSAGNLGTDNQIGGLTVAISPPPPGGGTGTPGGGTPGSAGTSGNPSGTGLALSSILSTDGLAPAQEGEVLAATDQQQNTDNNSSNNSSDSGETKGVQDENQALFWSWWWLLALALAFLIIFFLIWRRRKKDKRDL